MMKNWRLLFFLFSTSIYGQTEIQELEADQFLLWVDQNHPILKTVRNKLPIAQAELLKVRGSFDPLLTGQYADKEFQATSYYEFPSIQLDLPNAGPMDFQMNWKSTSGRYTNPQNQLPEEGLFEIGGMINLGNGLLTNERRTALAIAHANIDLTEAEAALYRNKLLAKALNDYWKWFEAHANVKAYEKAVEAAADIYTYTLEAFSSGAVAAIDTLDALALLNTWQSDYFQAKTKAISAMFEASNWLWSADGEPLILKPNCNPLGTLQEIEVELVLPKEHPLLVYNEQKEEQFRLQRNLAREYLKPKIAVGGALLLPGNFSEVPLIDEIAFNNRTVKAKVEVPLLLRSGRGYSQSQNLQLQNFQLERKEIENSWNNALNASAAGIIQLEKALQASLKNQENLRMLLEAEKRKLEFGDSELIMVNLRTRYYAKALIQTAEIIKDLGIQKALWQELSASF
jgi:hypothetical protein